MSVVMPFGFDGGDAAFADVFGQFSEEYKAWRKVMEASEISYKYLTGIGVTPQIARSVFPTCLASKIIMTMNLRAWRHFFVMRTSAQAHPQMRQVCDPLLEQFKTNIPLLYGEIVPGMQQHEAMRLAR